MGKMGVGSSDISEMSLGTNEVNKIYCGEDLVYEKSSGGGSVTVNYTVEANGTYGGIAFITPDMGAGTYDDSSIFADFDTVSGSFVLQATQITAWGWAKYGAERGHSADEATYSVNGGATVDITNTTYSSPVTINLNAGDTIEFYCYCED